MDKVIATVLLVIASVVCSVVVFNAVYPAVTSGSGAILEISHKVDDRIRSQVSIVKVSSQGNDVYIWVKNIGATVITGIDRMDVFFGTSTNQSRITYGGGSTPRWEYSLENDTSWVPSATVKITIYNTSLATGTYVVKVVTPNAISDEEFFSV